MIPPKTTVVLADVAELQRLIAQPLYSEADKARMLEILKKHKATGTSGPFFLQETRRRLYSNGKIVAEDGKIGSGQLSGGATCFKGRRSKIPGASSTK